MGSDRDRLRESSVVEVEFTVVHADYPFVEASKTERCQFDLVEIVPRDDGQCSEFFEVSGADPERIVDLAGAHETVAVHLLREYETGGLFEFLVSRDCPAVTLAELGALPRAVRSRDGTGHIRAEIPARYEPADVIESFLDEHREVELVSKRDRDSITPLFSNAGFEQVLSDNLTARQLEVLETAFEAGYYDWPRASTGSDVAEELGITSATFSQHIHAAERSLLAVLFDGNGEQ